MDDGRDVFSLKDTVFRMQLINIYEHFRHIQRLASDWSLVLEGGGQYVSLVIFLVEFLPNLTGGFKYYVFFTSTWGNDPIWLIFFRWVVSIIYRLLSNPRTTNSWSVCKGPRGSDEVTPGRSWEATVGTQGGKPNGARIQVGVIDSPWAELSNMMCTYCNPITIIALYM